jgi:preprotein translocase SecE subunit
MDNIINTIKENQNLLIASYIVLGLLSVNLLLIIISLIVKKSPFGIYGSIRRFIGKLFTELKLVEWLSFKETTRLTLIVLVVTIFFGVLIALLDLAFFKLRDLII